MIQVAPSAFAPDAEVWHCLREAWPPMAEGLATEAELLPLSDEDALALGSRSAWFRGQFALEQADPLPEAIVDAVEAGLATHGDGIFVKFGLFSLKSKDRAPEQTRVTSVSGLEAMLRPPPERMVRGLAHMLQAGKPVHMQVSPWLDIPRWAEFRAYFVDGLCAGVSQFYTEEVFSDVVANVSLIENAIAGLLPDLMLSLPLPKCAADLYLKRGEDGALACGVIEFNPLGPGTDLCLFAQDGGLDGTFRFRM